MRILLAGIYESPEIRKGGPPAVFSNIVEAISKYEFKHTLDIVSQSFFKNGDIKLGRSIFVIRVPIFNLFKLFFVIKMVLSKKYDIINLHGVSDLNTLLAFLGKLSGSIVIYSAHGLILNEMRMGSRYPLRLLLEERIIIKLSHCLVTVSRKFKEEIHRRLNYPKEKIYVIHNGISEDWFQSNRNYFDVNVSNPYLLFVGETTILKGFDILLKAFNLVKKMNRSLKLVVVGKKPRNTLLVNAGEFVSDIIFIEKPIRKDVLKQLYRNALALVLPSRQESFGLVVLEALSQGTPVIVSNSVGAAEILENGKYGLMFESGNPKDLHKCIEIILRDEALRRRAFTEGPIFAASRTWRRVLEHYIKLFEVIKGEQYDN